MSPEDTALYQHAIDTYNKGYQFAAYKQFCEIYSRGNAKDTALLCWIGYSTPRLDEAQRSLAEVERLKPNHPSLPKLRDRVSQLQRQIAYDSIGKVGPAMTCPYCHRSGPARVAKKIAIAGWVWFAVFFVLFLACLFTPIEYIQTYTGLVPADPGQAQSLVGEAVFFLLLGFVGFLFKKSYYTCGSCSIKLGDMAH